MKRFLISTLAVLSIGCAAAKNEITCVEPPMWWSGMQSKQLQLVVSGPAIRDASVSIDYPGVTIDSIVRPDSPNYQFVYLTLSQEAEPGEMVINFVNGKKKFKHKYQLLKRDMPAADYQGFSSEDALYLMMPDRFADGDESNNSNSTLRYDVAVDRSKPNSRHGGDLAGIRSRLDYLKQLGVTAIWLTPVLENDMPGGSYHGYATTDYYRVDPRFGTNEEYRELIAECHKLGIKVVMDMIFNHCGIAHPWLEDAPMKDWFNSPIDVASLNNQKVDATGGKFSLPDGYKDTNFRLNTNYDPYVSDYDIDRTVNGWFVLGMPDLNQKNPHLMTYLIQNSIWWVEYAKINGIRMDTYPYADMQAMARWNVAVRNEYPNFNIVGESWLEDPAGIAFMQKGNKLNPIDTELPVVMDFPLMLSAQKTFNDETLPWAEGLNNLYNHLALDMVYPNPKNVLTFYDNHDTDRFLAVEPNDLSRWKQAQAFLLTARGIPQIYYGTEILMSGKKDKSDGYVRLDMPGGWATDSIDAFTAEGRTPLQNEAFNYLSRLLNWRQGNKAISDGSTKHFLPMNRLYVYERKAENRRVVVILNGTDGELADVDMSRYAEIFRPGDKFRDVMTGEELTIGEKMTFAPRATLILE